jgi:hypothetical protein
MVCVDCGFLGIDAFSMIPKDILAKMPPNDVIELGFRLDKDIALSMSDRQNISNHKYHDQIPRCERKIWALSHASINEANEDSIFSLLTQERKCKYFFPYSPGLSPKQHFDLEQQHRTNTLLWRVGITGAIVGAAAAIIAGVVGAILANWHSSPTP